jgi:tRNA 2-thiouridine synthesizing protein A
VITLDCRGKRCPLPIIELARHIEDVDVGGALAVEADDPAAGPDVAAWCRMRGHELARTTTADDGTPRFEVRRLN